MKNIYDAWLIPIDITNACINKCAHCTRATRHFNRPYFMDLDTVEKALKSLRNWKKNVGCIGGEPTIHPQFEEICRLFRKYFPRNRCALFTCGGEKYKKYEDLIHKTFGIINYNEHKKPSHHQPMLVASQEVIKDKELLNELIDNCWLQYHWCPSITIKGCFFCEVAGTLDMLFDGPGGYPIKPGWWKIRKEQFHDQKERYCKLCSICIPIPSLPDNIDYELISKENAERLKNSPLKARGKLRIADHVYTREELEALVESNSYRHPKDYWEIDDKSRWFKGPEENKRIVSAKKHFYDAINFLTKKFCKPIYLAIQLLKLMSPASCASIKRILYKMETHYFRYNRFPVENPFIPKSNKTIIFFPALDWLDLKQRQHHLADAFSKAGWTVIYFTHDLHGEHIKDIKEINERFFLCSNIRALIKYIKNPWIYLSWTVNMYYLKYFDEYNLIFDYENKLESYPFYTKKMLKEQREALKVAKIVMASSKPLRDEISQYRSDALLIPNSVFPEDFALKDDQCIPEDIFPVIKQGKPIIGYWGSFAKWKIDKKLLKLIAGKMPDINIVMIGSDTDGSHKEYEWNDISNIYFLGSKKYEELPYYAPFFDAAILPLLVNEVTQKMSPKELLEFIASKLPVVSTDISECRKCQSVLIAKDHEEFLVQIRKALSLKNDPAYRDLLKTEIKDNTWDIQCEKIIVQMKKHHSIYQPFLKAQNTFE